MTKHSRSLIVLSSILSMVSCLGVQAQSALDGNFQSFTESFDQNFQTGSFQSAPNIDPALVIEGAQADSQPTQNQRKQEVAFTGTLNPFFNSNVGRASDDVDEISSFGFVGASGVRVTTPFGGKNSQDNFVTATGLQFIRFFDTEATGFGFDRIESAATYNKEIGSKQLVQHEGRINGLTRRDRVSFGVESSVVFSPTFSDFTNASFLPNIAFSRANIGLTDDTCGEGDNEAICTSLNLSVNANTFVAVDNGEGLDNFGLFGIAELIHRIENGPTFSLRGRARGFTFYRVDGGREDIEFDVRGLARFPIPNTSGLTLDLSTTYTNRLSTTDENSFDSTVVAANLTFPLPSLAFLRRKSEDSE